jgi:site-specific DNA-methyltransferase (adenine-specific)
MVFITGNSGFPKYLNTSKAIDAHFGKKDERKVVGSKAGLPGYREGFTGNNDVYGKGLANGSAKCAVTEAATPEAAHFDGWATALKPGWEPFVVGVKAA